jgi:hypothetical protein
MNAQALVSGEVVDIVWRESIIGEISETGIGGTDGGDGHGLGVFFIAMLKCVFGLFH